ncbi:MAG: hypothetical protein ACHQ01_02455 [Candidatus Limnocylindrales bacterium]
MHRDETLTSVSVATLEFLPAATGTHMILTEQGAYIEGIDNPAWREQGTRDLLDNLKAELQRNSQAR